MATVVFQGDLYQLSSAPTPSDTVTYDSLNVVVTLPIEVVAANNVLPTKGLGNTAMAFQPGPPEYINVEAVADIKIWSVNGYNAQMPAGVDLANSLAYSAYYWSADDAATKQSLIEKLNATNYGSAPAGFVFKPAEAPDEEKNQQFVVELYMQGGTVIRDTTTIFYLKK
ncbi:MAG: hypothetical protein QM642_04740 [Edaphocola sp.]